MVEIGQLLDINAHYPHANTYASCIGDQYLYARNPLYRTIRDAALAHGVSYVEVGSDLWHDYMVCPLFCLDVMLQQKMIPLINNELPLRRLAVKSGRSFAITGRFLTRVMKRNYLLHESCHYIAHCISSEEAHDSTQHFHSDREFRVATAFLGEAFAGLTERIAWVVAQNPTHILFFNLNSYVDHDVREHKLLTECIDELGLSQVCEIGMLALFINNLKKRPLEDKEMDALLCFCFSAGQPPRPVLEKIVFLIRNVFSIAPAFLEETTPAYFRMVGLEKEFLDLSSRDWSVEQLSALMAGEAKAKLLRIIMSAIPNVASLLSDNRQTSESELAAAKAS